MLPGMCSNFTVPWGVSMWQRRWIWDRITGFLLTADRKIWNVCLLFPQIYGKKTVSSVEQADFGRVFRMLWKHIIRNVFLLRLLVWQELLEMMQSQNRQMRK